MPRSGVCPCRSLDDRPQVGVDPSQPAFRTYPRLQARQLVGELSAGTGLGIGRAILSSAYFYSTGPEKLFAAVLVLAGLLAYSFAIILFPGVPGLGLYVGTIGFGAFMIAFFIVLERAAQGFKAMVPIRCSIYDVRFWRHERFWRFIQYPLPLLNGTPFKPMFWRLQGVRMGKRVFDDGCIIPEKSLVTIGDDVTLNNDSIVQCHSMEDGLFKLDAIEIGKDATVGVYVYVHYDVVMGEGSLVEPDSFLMKGARVPAGARFGGNPAQEIEASRPGPAVAGGAAGASP